MHVSFSALATSIVLAIARATIAEFVHDDYTKTMLNQSLNLIENPSKLFSAPSDEHRFESIVRENVRSLKRHVERERGNIEDARWEVLITTVLIGATAAKLGASMIISSDMSHEKVRNSLRKSIKDQYRPTDFDEFETGSLWRLSDSLADQVVDTADQFSNYESENTRTILERLSEMIKLLQEVRGLADRKSVV